MPTKTKKHLHTHQETDLTRTATLHKQYAADLYKRFRRLKGLIREAVVTQDIFNLKQRTPFSMRMALHQKVEILPNPKDFDFKTDAEKIDMFSGWLEERTGRDILEVTKVGPAGQVEARNPWQNTYVRRGYGKGVKHADAALRKEGVDVPTDERLNRVFNMPVHARTLEQLYTRNFRELKGITAMMDQQISRRLANGFAQGWNPRKVARKINDRVDKIGITRARVLARTETIRAHYESSMSRYKQYNIQWVEFIYGGGPCKSNICPPYDGKVFKVGEEIEIPLHPRCGCAYKPKVEKPDKVSKVEEIGPEAGIPKPPGIDDFEGNKKWLEDHYGIRMMGDPDTEDIKKVASHVTDDFYRIARKHPELKGKIRANTIRFSDDFKHMGRYEILDEDIKINVSELKDSWMRHKSVAGDDIVQDLASLKADDGKAIFDASMARHEVGHSLQEYGIGNLKKSSWKEIYDSFGGEVKDYISRYGATDPREGFAEAFSLYTHPNYSGQLPAEMESYIEENLFGAIS